MSDDARGPVGRSSEGATVVLAAVEEVSEGAGDGSR
jgi:hypothetical protein